MIKIDPLVNPPSRGQNPEDFTENADNLLEEQLPRAIRQMNALGDEMEEAVLQVAGSVAEADLAAEMAAAAIEGLSNFRGLWANQTGPLSPPASVFHRGQAFLLLEPLPNVALSEPGVDESKWMSLARKLIITTGSLQALPGDEIVCLGAGPTTVNLPSGPSVGDFVTVVRTGAGLVTVSRAGSTIMGVAENMVLDRQHWNIRFFFTGTTWRMSMEGVTL